MGMIVSVLQMNSINGRFTSMENRMTSLESNLSGRLASLDARFETLVLIKSDRQSH